jgi:hypothetical protein
VRIRSGVKLRETRSRIDLLATSCESLLAAKGWTDCLRMVAQKGTVCDSHPSQPPLCCRLSQGLPYQLHTASTGPPQLGAIIEVIVKEVTIRGRML